MSLFQKKKAASDKERAPTRFRVGLLPDEGKFTGDDGAVVTYEGFEPYLDPACTDHLPVDQQCYHEPRIFHCRVAGTVAHHQGDVQRPCFEIGGKVAFIAERNNTVDPNALLVVDDPAARFRAGYVPRDMAAVLHPWVTTHGGGGVVIKTYEKHGRRIGLRIIGSLNRPMLIESVNR